MKNDVLQGIRRFPSEGWIRGSVTDIATAIRVGATPISRVEHAAYDLEYGVNEAAEMLESAIKERPKMGRQIEKHSTSRKLFTNISNGVVDCG